MAERDASVSNLCDTNSKNTTYDLPKINQENALFSEVCFEFF